LTDVAIRVRGTPLSANAFHAYFSGQAITRRVANLFALVTRAPLAFGAIHSTQAHDFAYVPVTLLAQSALGVVVAYTIRSQTRLLRHGIRFEPFVARAHDVMIDGGTFRVYSARALAFTRI